MTVKQSTKGAGSSQIFSRKLQHSWERRGWRDKTILPIQKSQSAASMRLLCRRITATVVEVTFKTANTKMFCWNGWRGRHYYLTSHEESVWCSGGELFWQLQEIHSLQPCKITSWKAAWERLALLKVAERPCEIQSNPVPMEKGNGL